MKQEDSQMLDFCERINNLFTEHYRFMEDNCEIIDNSRKLKYLFCYSTIVCSYGKELSILQQLNWTTSSESLGRDLLEGYAIFKEMKKLFSNNTKFNDYIKYLVSVDLSQDWEIYKAIKTDPTYTDESQRSIEMNSHLIRYKHLINEFFPTPKIQMDKTANEQVIKPLVEKIVNNRNLRSRGKSTTISRALQANRAWKNDGDGTAYSGSKVIYKQLCHASHQNLSAVEERLICDGMFMLNSTPKNNLALLSLVYYCMKDVLMDVNDCTIYVIQNE